MGNLITDRVAFFLKDVPPFSFLNGESLDKVAQHITVQYFEPDAFVFEEGAPKNDCIYILRQGDIKLLKSDGAIRQLVDQCEPGDIFGIRAILTDNPYSMSAQCATESLLYTIPNTLFKELLNSNQSFALFFAKGYAAGQVIIRKDEEQTSIAIDAKQLAHDFHYSKSVITCDPTASIKEAATKMKEAHVGSIVITDEQHHAIGIVTDTDLRNKVVAGTFSSSDAIQKIMASPVRTIEVGLSVSEVIMEMVRSGVHHLVMTADGTDTSPITGIVSDHDVMVSQQNHPASLIKEIKRANDSSRWPKLRDQAEEMVSSYLNQGLNVRLIASTITKINDTIIEKAIEKALSDIPELEDVSFCWLNLGSEGREEQLLRTDQDNAIIFADTEDNETTQKQLLKLASTVTQLLDQCGFEKCPAEIMASNPKYCQPLSSWKKYFKQWIASPEPKAVMNATIFFDFRAGWGNHLLAASLSEYLIEELKARNIFMHFLAQNALQNPPPLSFFKHFLVESSGEHKNSFDIKKRGMMPLSDAARLLLLHHHVTGIQNTSMRYEKLMELEPKNEAVFKAAAAAYELFLKHRTLNGLKQANSGRFLPIEEMDKYDKQILKNAFLSIKEIQEVISVRFQQSYFS